MSWRPENWADIRTNAGGIKTFSIEADFFEAGAGAMLEALKKDGVHFEKGEWTDDATFEVDNPGTVVFIPDS